jgi:hypothetical protein
MRDPGSLYAHWDLTADQQKHYSNLSTDHYLSLRVHEENSKGPLIAELRIHPESRHSFVHLNALAGKYVAELGYIPSNGPWTAIATSDPADAFDASMEAQPVRFATITFTTIAPAGSGAPLTDSSLEATMSPTAAVQALSRSADLAPPTAVPVPGPFFELTRTHPELAVHMGGALEDKRAVDQLLPPIQGAADPLTRVQFVKVSNPKWTVAQERALAEIIGLGSPQNRLRGSQEMAELMQGQVLAPISSIEAAVGPSSFLESQPSGAPGFWFSVNAELVIYGATEPSAMVTIAGRPIRLRPDGSFSYRFALPDGHYRLELAAVSTQGDVRQADLNFHRGTAYSGEVQRHPQDPQLKVPIAENLS